MLVIIFALDFPVVKALNSILMFCGNIVSLAVSVIKSWWTKALGIYVHKCVHTHTHTHIYLFMFLCRYLWAGGCRGQWGGTRAALGPPQPAPGSPNAPTTSHPPVDVEAPVEKCLEKHWQTLGEMNSKAGSEGGAPWQGNAYLDGIADHGESCEHM